MAEITNYTPGEYAKEHIRITPTTLADGRDFFYLDDDPEYVSGAKTRELKDPRPLDYRFAPHLDADGNVSVNGSPLEEPYLTEKAYGETNIQLPYQVPDERYFLMGDNRSVSVDSRNTTVGCISRDQIVGKVIFRIWPLSEFGPVR